MKVKEKEDEEKEKKEVVIEYLRGNGEYGGNVRKKLNRLMQNLSLADCLIT
jgi:aromatic ring hydroxylase